MILATATYFGSIYTQKYLKCCIGCEFEYLKKSNS